MPFSSEPVVQQALVEVRYGRGMVYLDHCGSLSLKLQDALGKAFETSVSPQMEFGELRSPLERIVVRYGRTSLLVQQDWVKTAVRVEQVTPVAWEQVSETLSVGPHVARCGARFLLAFRSDDLDDAEARLRQSGLVAETSQWQSAIGAASQIACSTFTKSLKSKASELRGGSLRAGLSVVEFKVQPNVELSEDMRALLAPWAIVLDLDYAQPGADPYALGRGQLKDFLRAAWLDAKEKAATIGKLLEKTDGA